MIEYRKGDLFKVPVESNTILTHACNARGSWNGGIARLFLRKYPKAHKQYALHCRGRESVGMGFVVVDRAKIGCLITSDGYGKRTDSPRMIVSATYKAVQALLNHLEDGDHVHSPLINSGLFKTPWSDTEYVIEQALKASLKDISWTVWEI